MILLRADMDALPVAEDTGLSYASRTDGVMHACGHDVHVTALLATCAALSADPTSITGTVVAVFQPAEETGSGARAMVDDGIFDRFHDRTSAWDSTWARLLRGCWSANPTS